MIRVLEEQTKAKSGSVGSAGKRCLECRNGAGQRRLGWKDGYRNARLEIPECAGKRGLESRKDKLGFRKGTGKR